jgi:hypothetical protein
MRSRQKPMNKAVRILGADEQLLMSWYHAREEIPIATVEAPNDMWRVSTKRSYGFRTVRLHESRDVLRSRSTF